MAKQMWGLFIVGKGFTRQSTFVANKFKKLINHQLINQRCYSKKSVDRYYLINRF